MSKKFIFIFFIIFLGIFLFPPVSSAQGLVPCGNPGQPPCQLCHFFVMLDRILDFIFTRLVPAVAVLMLMIGGVMFFFAGGSPQTLGTAKSIITSVFIGLIIIFAAWLIINTFFLIIGVAAWTGLAGGWFTIDCPIT